MPQPIDPKTTLEFERRVLEPSKYPVIHNDDGTDSTHKMAWGSGDDKYFAYPTIVTAPDGTLIELAGDVAWSHAKETGEYRTFNTAEEAAAYADGGYKASWGAGEKK